MKYHLFLLLILLSNNLFCQDNFEELDFLFPGDSIPSNTFMLDEVTVYQPLSFENDDEIKRYVILRYRVKKVYSYAKLASERINRINQLEILTKNRIARLKSFTTSIGLNMSEKSFKSKREENKKNEDHDVSTPHQPKYYDVIENSP